MKEMYTARLQVKATTSSTVSEAVIQPELEDATPFLSLSPASGSHTRLGVCAALRQEVPMLVVVVNRGVQKERVGLLTELMVSRRLAS